MAHTTLLATLSATYAFLAAQPVLVEAFKAIRFRAELPLKSMGFQFCFNTDSIVGPLSGFELLKSFPISSPELLRF